MKILKYLWTVDEDNPITLHSSSDLVAIMPSPESQGSVFSRKTGKFCYVLPGGETKIVHHGIKNCGSLFFQRVRSNEQQNSFVELTETSRRLFCEKSFCCGANGERPEEFCFANKVIISLCPGCWVMRRHDYSGEIVSSEKVSYVRPGIVGSQQYTDGIIRFTVNLVKKIVLDLETGDKISEAIHIDDLMGQNPRVVTVASSRFVVSAWLVFHGVTFVVRDPKTGDTRQFDLMRCCYNIFSMKVVLGNVLVLFPIMLSLIHI